MDDELRSWVSSVWNNGIEVVANEEPPILFVNGYYVGPLSRPRLTIEERVAALVASGAIAPGAAPAVMEQMLEVEQDSSDW